MDFLLHLDADRIPALRLGNTGVLDLHGVDCLRKVLRVAFDVYALADFEHIGELNYTYTKMAEIMGNFADFFLLHTYLPVICYL